MTKEKLHPIKDWKQIAKISMQDPNSWIKVLIIHIVLSSIISGMAGILSGWFVIPSLAVLGNHILLGIGGGLIILLTSQVINLFPAAKQFLKETREIYGIQTIDSCFKKAISSGVGEEILIRGTLLPLLGILPSTIIFALIHVVPDLRCLYHVAWTFIVGIFLGGLFIYTGSLIAPIVAHFTNNLIAFLYIRYKIIKKGKEVFESCR